ncbi:MAG: 2-oxo-4-hydroxy-4-carboxy-5-ureidoimidazoline decarboxylase [Planctomycetota bacterium]
MLLGELNNSADDQAYEALLGCCGSSSWVRLVLQDRPFGSIEQLHQSADRCFDKLSREGWLEAFAAHPKLGDLDSLRMKFAGNKRWSAGEQSGVEGADSGTIEALAKGNARYEQAFGYIFILCATGVSADQMLASLDERLNNPPEKELNIAAEQQRKITHLRIAKLFDSQDKSA